MCSALQTSPAAPASPAPLSTQGIAVPSPAPPSASVVPIPQSGSSGGGGKPGWVIAVIVIAVLIGVFIAANIVYWSWWLVRAPPIRRPAK